MADDDDALPESPATRERLAEDAKADAPPGGRVSEERLRLMIESVTDCAIFMLDPEGRVISWNTGAERLKGYRAKEIIGRSFESFYQEEDIRAAKPTRELAEARAVGRCEDEGWRVRKDGTLFWANVIISAVRDARGTLIGFTKVTRDLTERKKAEETARELVREQAARSSAEEAEARARESEERYRELSDQLEVTLQGVTTGITVQDANGSIIYANDAAVEISGFSSRDELLSVTAADILRRFEVLDERGRPIPNDRFPGRMVLRGLRAEPLVVHVRERETGRERWTHVTAAGVRHHDGKPSMAVNIMHDVTQSRRQSEATRLLDLVAAALAQSLERDVALESLAGLLVSALGDGCAIELLEHGELRLASLAHRDPSKVEIARRARERCANRPEARRGIESVVRTGRPELYAEITDEMLVESARDEEHLRLVRSLGLRSAVVAPLVAHGRLLGAMVIFSSESRRRYDEADLKLAEEIGRRAGLAVDNSRLYEAERLARTRAESAERALREVDERRNEFLAVLAHELRNPLAPVVNAIEILRKRGSDDPLLKRSREIIGRQVEHMARMVDDLLDASRLSRGKVRLRTERLDLTAVVRNAVEDHRADIEASSLSLAVDVPSDPVWTLGDETRLAQVVGNLLHNAIKFTDAGGSISVGLAVADGEARLSVRDTGVGIKQEVLARIFEAFNQDERTLARTRGGLGLGLALVKGLVDLHGGTVSAESEGPGRGSEFRVDFPLRSVEPTSDSTEESASGERSKRILIVEDNEDAAEMLAAVLEIAGHSIAVSHDGTAGLARARSFRPDLVFCDIGLPGELDGYGVARAFRDDPELSSCFLVALTGYGQEEDRTRATQAGFDIHLTKPVQPEQLEDVIRKA